jgi:hypothetical protein
MAKGDSVLEEGTTIAVTMGAVSISAPVLVSLRLIAKAKA